MSQAHDSGATARSTAWRLAIDLGTTYTSATIESAGVTELLMIGGEPRVPSTVAVDEQGALLAGVGAERVLARSPERAERNPKRRIGDEFIVLGGETIRTVDALAAVLRLVADEARTRFGGSDPTELVLTHPARWGAIRLGKLVDAAAIAGLPEPLLVSEPIAAAWAASATAGIAVGATAAIYDLGGGTLDIAVVRRTDTGFDVVGPPGGSDRIGGEMFDERLYQYLGDSLAISDPDAWEHLRFSTERAWRRASHDFRAQVRSTKEALSVRPDDALYVGAPVDRELRLTRDELGMVLEGDIAASVTELADTIGRAGVRPGDLDHVFLVGGGSRVPQVAQRIGEWLGSVPTTWGDPKSVVAIGALAAAADGRRLSAVAPTGAVPVVAVAPDTDAVTIVTMSDEAGVVDLTEPVAVATRFPAPDPGPTAARATTAPSVSPTRRRRWPLAVAAVAVVALAGGAIAWATSGNGADADGDAPGTTLTVPSTTADGTDLAAFRARLVGITADLDRVDGDLDAGRVSPEQPSDRTTLAELRTRAEAFATDDAVEPDAIATFEADVSAFLADIARRTGATSTTTTSSSSSTSSTSTTSTTSTSSTTSTTVAAVPGATTTLPRNTPTTTLPRATPTTTLPPVVVAPEPTTTTQAPPPPPPPAPTTTVAPSTNTVPNVVGRDYSTGAAEILNAGFNPVKATTTCTGGEPSSQIVAQSATGTRPLGSTVTLTVCV